MLFKDRNRSDATQDVTPALQKMLRALGSAGLLVIAFTSNVMADAFEIKESVAAAGGEIDDTTIVIKRLSDAQHWIANSNRAQLRFSPASTSKIPHSLIALENGLASSLTIFDWDGVPRPRPIGWTAIKQFRRGSKLSFCQISRWNDCH